MNRGMIKTGRSSPKPRRKPVDEEAIANGERYRARASALMAGCGKLLTDFSFTAWNDATTVGVCLDLLLQAKGALEASRVEYAKVSV